MTSDSSRPRELREADWYDDGHRRGRLTPIAADEDYEGVRRAVGVALNEAHHALGQAPTVRELRAWMRGYNAGRAERLMRGEATER